MQAEKTRSLSEKTRDQEELEILFKQHFTNHYWQNAVLHTVVKTSLDDNPHLKVVVKTEEENATCQSRRLDRRLSSISGIGNFNQLLEVHDKTNRGKDPPDLMTMSTILRYVLNNTIIVRQKRGGRRNAVCEDSLIDRELVVIILKKFILEKTLLQYALD